MKSYDFTLRTFNRIQSVGIHLHKVERHLKSLQNVSRCSNKACVELYMLTDTVLADTDAN